MIKRRDFLKGVIIGSGALILSPGMVFAESGDNDWRPAYAELEDRGGFVERIEEAYGIFEACELCPRQCGVNRLKEEKGFCRAPLKPVIFSVHPHFGEELSLVGDNGSGTIFFSNCNLRCSFCQNWPISIEGRGRQYSEDDLAKMMLGLQKIGCHNINLVTPTHVMPNILKAVRIALKQGLRVPLVYNTSGYERVEIVRLLDGIVDIYLPDLKYMDDAQAEAYSSGASDYPDSAKESIIEMNRQVGKHICDHRDIALRGLMIRHLVMPNRVAGTKAFVQWVADALSKDTYVNIMAQYRVEYKAYDHEKIARAIKVGEFLEAIDWAEEAGLTNLDPRCRNTARIFRRMT